VAASQRFKRRRVQDREVETETVGHLIAPLTGQRRWTHHEHSPRPVAQDHLLNNEPRLDRLAKPYVVGDQQVDAGHRERLRDRLELVVLDRDTRPERRLQRVVVGAGDGAPAHGIEEGAEDVGVVPPVGTDVGQLGLR